MKTEILTHLEEAKKSYLREQNRMSKLREAGQISSDVFAVCLTHLDGRIAEVDDCLKFVKKMPDEAQNQPDNN